jgi:hypothetical protein
LFKPFLAYKNEIDGKYILQFCSLITHQKAVKGMLSVLRAPLKKMGKNQS